MIETDIHSRSRLAGYEPSILFNARVLIVGAGALGQNLALNLALAGVGELDIVDFDLFEAHNATRSPLYPTAEERAGWGLEKAKIVAHKLLPMMTAPEPKIRYAVAMMQSLGDLPLAHSGLTFAAVDNAEARAYLAERCRLLRRPLIEGGFHAEAFTLSVFGPDAADPCFRCLYPEKVGAYSCTRYALEVEEARIIPAIQNTAAVLAGLQAEAGIQWLHGNEALRNKQVYGNIRRMSLLATALMASPECPASHRQPANATPIVLDITPHHTLNDLLALVAKELGPAEIVFPEQLVMRNFCTRCTTVAAAHAPEWRWLASPFCTNCGGPFPPATTYQQISSRASVHTGEQDEVTELPCAEAGLVAGATFEVWPDTNESGTGDEHMYLLQMGGTIDQLMTLITR